MSSVNEVYRRVREHPDYRRMRVEAEQAHAAMTQGYIEGDASMILGAQAVMKGANDVITQIYDTVISAMRNEDQRGH